MCSVHMVLELLAFSNGLLFHEFVRAKIGHLHLNPFEARGYQTFSLELYCSHITIIC